MFWSRRHCNTKVAEHSRGYTGHWDLLCVQIFLLRDNGWLFMAHVILNIRLDTWRLKMTVIETNSCRFLLSIIAIFIAINLRWILMFEFSLRFYGNGIKNFHISWFSDHNKIASITINHANFTGNIYL